LEGGRHIPGLEEKKRLKNIDTTNHKGLGVPFSEEAALEESGENFKTGGRLLEREDLCIVCRKGVESLTSTSKGGNNESREKGWNAITKRDGLRGKTLSVLERKGDTGGYNIKGEKGKIITRKGSEKGEKVKTDATVTQRGRKISNVKRKSKELTERGANRKKKGSEGKNSGPSLDPKENIWGGIAHRIGTSGEGGWKYYGQVQGKKKRNALQILVQGTGNVKGHEVQPRGRREGFTKKKKSWKEKNLNLGVFPKKERGFGSEEIRSKTKAK